MNNIMVLDLLGQVYINLKRSGTAYQDYLQHGKTFTFARILKIYNEKIRELLLEKGHFLPDELQDDALSLIAHYDIWLSKWNDLKEKLNPSPDEEFIFANEFIFPKKAAINFETEYKRLKQLVSFE